jgi:hypothetical protein
VGGIVMCDRGCPQLTALGDHDLNRCLGEQLERALRDGIEHRLRIGERTADQPENLRGRGLVLQRLVELCRPRLEQLA